MSFSIHYKQVIRDTFFQVDNCIGIDNQTNSQAQRQTHNKYTKDNYSTNEVTTVKKQHAKTHT